MNSAERLTGGLQPPPGVDRRELESALRACEEIAARDRSSLYMVSQFLRDRRRYEAFLAMYSVMRVIDDFVDAVPNPGSLGVDELTRLVDELDAWRDRIESCYAGDPGPGPLDVALASALATFPVPRDMWQRFLGAMRYDLSHDSFETVDSFVTYADGAAGAPTTTLVFLLWSTPVGADPSTRGVGEASTGDEFGGLADSRDAVDYTACGRELGIFAYIAHVLRDVASDLEMGERGRIYIPMTDLADAGLSTDDLRRFVRRGAADKRWGQLVATLVGRARRFERPGVRRARALYPVMEPDCRFALALLIALYRDLLDKIEAAPASVLTGPPAQDENRLEAFCRAASREAGYPPSLCADAWTGAE